MGVLAAGTLSASRVAVQVPAGRAGPLRGDRHLTGRRTGVDEREELFGVGLEFLDGRAL